MSVQLPDLTGKVVIDNSQGKAALAEIKAGSGDASTAMGVAGKSAMGLAVGFTAIATAAGTAIGVVQGLVKDFARAGSELVDLNKQLGIGVVEIQKLQYAAKMSGVEFSAVATGLMQMEKAASKTPEKFAQLGISFGQLRTSRPDELLELISDGLKGVSDQNERARISMELFGRGGSQMLKLLMDDFRGLTNEAKGTGLMTEEMAKRADQLDDAFTRLSDVTEKLKVNLGAAFANPVILAGINAMASAIGFLSRNAETLLGLLPGVGGFIQAGAAWRNYAEQDGGTLGGASSGGGGGSTYGLGKGYDNVTKGLSALDKAFDKLSARMEKDGVRAAERLETAEQRLFEQRSKSLGSATPLGGFPFWQVGTEDKYRVNNMPAGDPRKVYNLWGDKSKFLPPELEGNIHVAVEAQEKASNSAARWALGLQGVALMAGAIGGNIGAVAQVMGNIASSFQGFSKKDKYDQFNAVAGGVGQIGGLIGGTAGAGIQGAAGGAMAGFSVGGPVGAVVGGALGGIMGLFGASAAKKKELSDLKTQLSALTDEAKRFGISLDGAFASKNSSVVKAAIDSVNNAIKESEKRLAGLGVAAGGLNTFARGGGITDQASSDRAGMYAGAIFGGMVKETGDVVAALKAIGPALAEMAQKAKDLGLNLGAGVANLIGMSAILDADNGLADQLSGLNQMMRGLGQAGMVTRDLFVAFGADASAVFARLIEGGATGNQALALMQPTLQQLYEGQKLHGWAVDEATQALIDQAKAEGLVGDAFMSANERIVELLGIIIETIGGTLPESYRRAGDAAEEYARRASNLPGPPGGGGGGGGPYNYDGTPDGDGDPTNSFARGSDGVRDFGRESEVLLHGREAVLTEAQYNDLVESAAGADILASTVADIQGSIAALTEAVTSLAQNSGAVSISPQITVAVDAGATRRNQQDLLDNVERNVAEGVRRGTSPLLSALRHRGFRPSAS